MAYDPRQNSWFGNANFVSQSNVENWFQASKLIKSSGV